jgi:hypothetical protein
MASGFERRVGVGVAILITCGRVGINGSLVGSLLLNPTLGFLFLFSNLGLWVGFSSGG